MTVPLGHFTLLSSPHFPSPPADPPDLSPTLVRATAPPPTERSSASAAPAPVHPRTHRRISLRGTDPLAPSDTDVLALLLGQGRPSGAHVDLARRVLASLGGLAGLAEACCADLLTVRGLGSRRASVLSAAMELGRRSAGRRPERGQRLGAAADVFAHYRARLGSATTEEFWVLGLDVRHRLIFEACVARGSLTGVEVHPREVYRPLIRAAAAAVIFCHNHPSGDPTPSRQDFELTARLKEVGALCGITVLDHVVVAADGHVSLAERGWL